MHLSTLCLKLGLILGLFLSYTSIYANKIAPKINKFEKLSQLYAKEIDPKISSSLQKIAQNCSSATQLGALSLKITSIILQGLFDQFQSELKYIGIDQNPLPLKILNGYKKIAHKRGIDFTFWRAKELEIEIEMTDLLVINSVHTYCHVKYELENFARNAKKYIFFMGMEEQWMWNDDINYLGNYSEYPSSYSKELKGFKPALDEFLLSHPEWHLQQGSPAGLIILERIVPYDRPEPVYHPEINFALKNKIVLCTGPALGRKNLLIESTEADMALIPFKKIFVVTNDPTIMDITFNGKIPERALIKAEGKQLDCTNTIISSIKNAVNDPEVYDDDIILFKHESVYINDMDLIKKAVSKILEGYDMVVRLINLRWSKNYRGTDAFFVKVSAIKDLINKQPKVAHPKIICEKYFTDNLVDHIKNVYSIPYKHCNGGFTELGFYHLFSKYTIYRWDRKNRDTLFIDYNSAMASSISGN